MPTPSRKPFRKHPLTLAVQACCTLLGAMPLAQAGPTGGAVVGGSGTIVQSGLNTTINQASQNMAINWQSYNVAVDERVQYLQPNANSVSLNRILSNDGSTIAGRIDANGRVILVNPNGIFFTSTASLNVGSLIASGLDINPADFMNGQYIFNEIPGTSGAVINSGLINASLGGNVALLGRTVENNGLIVANLGTVTLAAGKEAVLTFDDAGLLGVRVSSEILQQELGVDPAVLNSGDIQAHGGRVLLTASQSQDVFSRAVNTGGLAPATSMVVNDDGSFTLGGADVLNSGTIDTSTTSSDQNVGRIVLIGENVTSSGTLRADAQSGHGGEIELHARDMTLLTENSLTSARAETNGQGGIVKVLGDKVGLFDQSTVDVSGANGGGQVLIGGDLQGRNAYVRNAVRTYVSDGSTVLADANESGNGGVIINWSEDVTWFYGTAYARGGALSGDGGLVEVSGKNYLQFRGSANTTAIMGSMGTLLLDPADITVLNGSGDTHPDGDNSTSGFSGCETITNNTCNGPVFATIQAGFAGPSTLYESELEGLAKETNIVLEATNNITINDLSDNVLNLKLTTGSIRFTADADGNGAGAFTMNSGDTIRTQGGKVTIEGASVTVGSINTTGEAGGAGGAVELTATAGDITAVSVTSNGGTAKNNENGNNAGDISIAGSGEVSIAGIVSAAGSGGDSSNQDRIGGNAGSVAVSGSLVYLGGDIFAFGGDGNLNGTRGDGGNVIISGPVIWEASAVVNAGGAVRGNIKFDGALNSANTIDHNLTLTGRNIEFAGAVGSTNRLGSLAIDATGSVSSGANAISAGGLTVSQSVSFASGAITTSNSSGNGGSITIISSGSVGVGALNTSSTASNGSGGAVSVGANQISLHGDVNTQGAGTGTAGAAQFTLSSAGTVTINYAGAFTSGLAVTGSSGGGADTLVGASRDNAWQVSDANFGTLNTNIAFSGFENLTGNAGEDVFTYTATGSVSGLVNGGDGNDTVDQAGLGVVSIALSSFQSIENFLGNGLDSTLIGADTGNDWSITGVNTGTVNGTAGFSGFNNLTGGSGNDGFVLSGPGIITGTIDGGAGSGVDSLSMSAGDNVWVISAANTGSVITAAGTQAFGAMDRLNGGTGDDIFEFSLVPTAASVAVNGGGGAGVDTVNFKIDNEAIVVQLGATGFDEIEAINNVGLGSIGRLFGDNTPNTWEVDSADGGIVTNGVTTTSFRGFGYLTGASERDDFVIVGAGSISGVIDGGGGDNMLIGRDAVYNAWLITGENNGTVSGIIFTNFNYLVGGSATDVFTYTANGVVTGRIDGGAGIDTVNMSSRPTVDIVLGQTVTNVENLIGNPTTSSNRLTGEGIDSDWYVTGTNSGTVNGIAFTNFNDLVGGAAVDRFTVAGGSIDSIDMGAGDDWFTITGGTVVGSVDGNLGDDWFTASDGTVGSMIGGSGTDYIVYTQSGKQVEVGVDLNGFEGVAADGTGVLIGQDLATIWTINGSNAGSVADDSGTLFFTGFSTLLGGAAEDTFDITGSGSITGTIEGNGGNDRLNVTLGGAQSGGIRFLGGDGADEVTVTNASMTATYTPDVAGYDRIVAGNGFAIHYQDSESITLNGTTTTLTINGSGAGETIELASDTFRVGDYTPVGYSGVANVTVNGQADTVNLTGFSLPNGTLSLTTEFVTASGTLTADTLILNDGTQFGSAGGLIGTTLDHLYLVNAGPVYIAESGGLNLYTTGNVTNTGIFRITGTTEINAGGGSLTLDNAGNDFDIVNVSNAAAISLRDANRINGGSVAAGSVTLNTVTGIGSAADANGSPSAAFTTQTANLTVNNSSSGGVYIQNTGAATVNVVNRGDIGFENSGNLTINRLYTAGSEFSNRGQYQNVVLSVTGGAVQGTTRSIYDAPDITAFDLTVVVGSGGGLGTPVRPMSIAVVDTFTYIGGRGYVYYFGDIQPNEVFGVDDLVTFRAFDSLTNLRLLEIESLGEFDPAIFTEVRNYYYEDVAILMPADQRFDSADDEDGKDQRQAKEGRL